VNVEYKITEITPGFFRQLVLAVSCWAGSKHLNYIFFILILNTFHK